MGEMMGERETARLVGGPFVPLIWAFVRADDGIRTRDPNLGKVVLYQLSHVRV